MVNLKLKRNKRYLINNFQQTITISVEDLINRHIDSTFSSIIWRAINIQFTEINEKIHSNIHVHISDKFQA